MRHRRVLIFSVLFVFSGCALHAVPFTEPIVGYAMVWDEPNTTFPSTVVFGVLGFIGDGSEPACRNVRAELIARLTKPLSQRAEITMEDARVTLEKDVPYCAAVILRPASAITANFTVALGRRGLFTQVIGWRTDLACRNGLAKMELDKLQCVPAFLIQAPSRVSANRASLEGVPLVTRAR